jgi:hypothetical protein
VHREVRRAGAVPDQHRAGDQQQPKWFIHGTGPVSGLGPFALWTILPIPSTEQTSRPRAPAQGGGRPTTPVRERA